MTNETFGQRLKRLREAKGLTHQQLMADHFIDTDTLMSAESSVLPNIWPAFTVFKAAKALGVSMDYLYTGVDSTANTPGKRIRARRDELGWEIDELHDNCPPHPDLTRSELMEAECDDDDQYIDLIAVGLGVTSEWLKTGNEPKFPPTIPNAQWFKGWLEEPRVSAIWSYETHIADKLKIELEVQPGYGRKVIEMIRTGKGIE